MHKSETIKQKWNLTFQRSSSSSCNTTTL